MFAKRVIHFCAAVLLIASSSVGAQERITRFVSDIVIHHDASMRVQETITVISTGRSIRRGIVREFPTSYTDYAGSRYVVDFDLVAAEHNGKAVAYHVEDADNGKRIYLGDKNRLLPPGIHTFSLVYVTQRQLGFFDNHDELFWNVTGNGWRLPIDEVQASIHLPVGVTAATTAGKSYTGYQGDYGTAARTSIGEDAVVRVITTHTLEMFQGLSVVVTWPKGFVQQPTWLDTVWWFARDNWSIAWMILGFMLLIAYLGYHAARARGMNKQGTVIPLFYPPKGMSPAAVGYMNTMGYKDLYTAAEWVNLAVKGYVTIIHKKGSLFSNDSYTIAAAQGHETASDSTDLLPHQKALLKLLHDRGDTLSLTPNNASTIVQLKEIIRRSCSSAFDMYFASFSNEIIVAVVIAVVFCVPAWLLWNSSWLLFGLCCYGAVGVTAATSLLKAYTPSGRSLQDSIDGFKLFLATTEADRMAMVGTPPTRTPELYEHYLPYAMVLGVEEQWTQQFTPVFAQLAQQGRPYVPVWYPVGNFSSGFAHQLSSSMSSAISSASTPPGRESGTGSSGGGSGRGGGGGGGGGW